MFCVVDTPLCNGAAQEVYDEHVLIAEAQYGQLFPPRMTAHAIVWSDAKTAVAADKALLACNFCMQLNLQLKLI